MSRIATCTCLFVSLLLMTFSTASAADQWISFEGKDGPGKGKHVVLMAGDEEYRSEESMPQMAKILAKQGFDCRVVFSIDPKTGLINANLHNNTPGLEALDNADLLIILARFRDLPDDQMKHVVDYVMKGKPVIGLRTATHAFDIKKGSTYAMYSHNSKVAGFQGGFGKQVLGETWVSHWGNHKHQSTRAIVVKGMESNPLLRGVGEIWVSTDVYEDKLPMQSSVQPLLLGAVLSGMKPTDQPIAGKKNDPMMPIAWTKTYKLEGGQEGKSFCTTMGASTDLVDENLRRLIVNAAYMLVGLDVPAKANVDIVGEYKPADYGFRKEQDLPKYKPEDFAKDTWPVPVK